MKVRTGCRQEDAKRASIAERSRVAGLPAMDAKEPAVFRQRIVVINGLEGSVSAEDVKTVLEVVTQGGFGSLRRATETPFNLVLEAKP